MRTTTCDICGKDDLNNDFLQINRRYNDNYNDCEAIKIESRDVCNDCLEDVIDAIDSLGSRKISGYGW